MQSNWREQKADANLDQGTNEIMLYSNDLLGPLIFTEVKIKKRPAITHKRLIRVRLLPFHFTILYRFHAYGYDLN